MAVIDEAWCIGCTLCIKACPADCIVGAPKAMHVIVTAQCTGCELCVPACPVDCISMPEVTTATGWAAWSQPQAAEARERYVFRQFRRHREAEENESRLTAESPSQAGGSACSLRNHRSCPARPQTRRHRGCDGPGTSAAQLNDG